MTTITIIQGPNLNLLGEREPEIYGTLTLEGLHNEIRARFSGHDIRTFQSNHEGAIIDALHDARKHSKGVVINAAALSHSSYAIYDAIKGLRIPCVEVHLTNVHSRESFRHTSMIAKACVGQVAGLGKYSYFAAVEYLLSLN